MARKLFYLLSVVLVFGLASAFAVPTQITLGGSSSGEEIDFSAVAGTSISMTITGSCTVPTIGAQTNCLSGPGFLQVGGSMTAAGSYYIWGSNTATLTQVTPGSYAVTGGTYNFYWSDGTNYLQGTMNFTHVADSTLTPRFNGILTITASTGVYATYWPAGQTSAFDVTLNTNSTIDNLWANGGRATGTVSSGEVVPVPEPGTMALLGSGLVAVGGFIRRKWRP